MPQPDVSTVSAELQSVTETLIRQRDRVGALAEPFLGTSREDIVIAIHEAERQLQVATRAMQRAIKAIER